MIIILVLRKQECIFVFVKEESVGKCSCLESNVGKGIGLAAIFQGVVFSTFFPGEETGFGDRKNQKWKKHVERMKII